MVVLRHKKSLNQFEINFHAYLIQKIIFITDYFLEMFQRNSKHFLSTSKKSSSSFTFSLRYYRDIADLLFCAFWEWQATHTQSNTINLWKNFVLICRKKINLIPHVFWSYCKDMKTFYFGYFGHSWLRSPKIIISTCRRLQPLSECQTSLFASFLRYYIFKNPAI